MEFILFYLQKKETTGMDSNSQDFDHLADDYSKRMNIKPISKISRRMTAMSHPIHSNVRLPKSRDGH